MPCIQPGAPDLNIELTRVLIGVAILLLITLLPVRADSRARHGFLGFILGIALVSGVVALVLHLGDFVLDSPAVSVVKTQIGVLQRDQADHVPKNLILIEGSSQTALGIDAAAIEEQLHQAGYDASVVQFSGVGGNHLERYVSLQLFAQELRRHGLALSGNTRLLLEVAPGYDRDPMRFMLNNRDTLRVYRYATLDNLLFTLHSLSIMGQHYDARTREQVGALIQDMLVSSLDIGLLPYMRRFDAVEPSPAFVPAPTQGRFKPYDPRRFADAPPAGIDPRMVQFIAYRSQRLQDLFGGGVTEVDYFSVPTVNNMNMLNYVHSFCAQRKPAPCIDATDPEIMAAVDLPRYFTGRDHLSIEGAAVYSRYFAQQLIAQGMVVR